MRSWNGVGVYQWEHTRRWELASGVSEFCRAEGALVVPGGFRSLSFFVRRQSQSASTFELFIWTTPIYFKPLDETIDSTTAPQYLLQLSLEPSGGLSLTSTAAKVFGARLQDNQPMGSLLFWEMKNTGGASANVVADIYVVPNHVGMLSLPKMGRTVDAGDGGPLASSSQSMQHSSLKR